MEGEVVPITVTPSGCLVRVYNGWLNSMVVMTCTVTTKGCAIPTENFLDPPVLIGNKT